MRVFVYPEKDPSNYREAYTLETLSKQSHTLYLNVILTRTHLRT